MTDMITLHLKTTKRNSPHSYASYFPARAGEKPKKVRFERTRNGVAIPVPLPRAVGEYLLREAPAHLEIAHAPDPLRLRSGRGEAPRRPTFDDDAAEQAQAAKAHVPDSEIERIIRSAPTSDDAYATLVDLGVDPARVMKVMLQSPGRVAKEAETAKEVAEALEPSSTGEVLDDDAPASGGIPVEKPKGRRK